MTRVRNSKASNAQTLKVRIAKSFSVDFLSDNHRSERLEFYLFYKIAGTSDKVLEVKLVHTLFKDILFQSKIKSSQINARSCRQK